MESVLRNPSLLTEIFDFLQYHCPRRGHMRVDRRSAARAALTCKAFLCPALDALWKKTNGFRPFFHLIPQLKYKRVVDSAGTKWRVACTEKPLVLSDLTRMVEYGRRIRCFIIDDRHGAGPDGVLLGWIDPSLLQNIMSLLEGQILIPFLRDLSVLLWPHGDGTATPCVYLPLLVSPMLESISFYPYINILAKGEWSVTQASAPEISRFIKQLLDMPDQRLQHIEADMPMSKDVIQSLLKPNALHSLRFSTEPKASLDLEAFYAFAPTGNCLTDVMCGLTAPRSQLLIVPEGLGSFAQLTDLEFASDLATANTLFGTCDFPVLSKMIYNYGYQRQGNIPSPELWQSFFERLASHAPCLRSVRLFEEELDDHQPVETILNVAWSALTPLYNLPLKQLSVFDTLVSSLANYDFHKIASAWPELETLQIATSAPGTLDYTALFIVASNLPCLRTLKLTIELCDASPEAFDGILAPPILTHQLELLDIGWKDDSHARGHYLPSEGYNLARFLDLLFPVTKLTSFLGYSSYTDLAPVLCGLKDTRKRQVQETLRKMSFLPNTS